jgi:hypothetical protein
MSPAYWIYLAMAVTVLFNTSNAYSRFRLWRIDANREMLESRPKALTGLGSTSEHIKRLPPGGHQDAGGAKAGGRPHEGP